MLQLLAVAVTGICSLKSCSETSSRLQAYILQLIKKRESIVGVFLQIVQNFQRNYSVKHL